MANRVAFLVDGFNLYHSLIEASRELGGGGTKWLDLRALCSTFLSAIGGDARLSSVTYFSALATYKEAFDPGVTARHLEYIACLRSTGVEVVLGKFKTKPTKCSKCHRESLRHEEKETDVAIGVKMLELFWTDACDTLVLMTGDSDLAPAMRAARRHFPLKKIRCCFPFKRISFELESLADQSFRIKSRRYLVNQFPDPVILPNGSRVSKPTSW